jgi:molybdenum cofactor cytidylyltransferase
MPSARSDPKPVRLPLHEALGVRRRRELVSIVGGGGKSALLFALASREISDSRWVLTTTTRIFAAQLEGAPACCEVASTDLSRELDEGVSGLLVIGEVSGEKAIGVRPDVPGRLLSHPHVHCVAVEADGSRQRPAKAPAEHEPVIPEETTLTVIVAGIDALEGPIGEVTHRPERVASITGRSTDQWLRVADLATLLRSPAGGRRGVPETSRLAVLINKVETRERRTRAREVAEVLLREAGIERVVIGSLQDEGGAWETYVGRNSTRAQGAD